MSSRVNLLLPTVRANPYPTYAELRRTAPVTQVDPGGIWVVTRYEDVLQVLKNPQVFSSAGLRFSTQPPWLNQHNPLNESLALMDPPQHGRLRSLINHAFSSATLVKLTPHVRALAQRLTEEAMSQRTVEFVNAFALPLTVGTLGELMGLDASLQGRFKQWSDDLFSVGAIGPDDKERQASVIKTLTEMKQYFAEVLESRRREPREDLVTALLRSRVDDEALSEAELLGFLFTLLTAGFETTLHLLSHCVMRLARSPEILARLRAEPALIPRFIEEVLRHEPVSHGTFRLTLEDVELRGVRIPRGSPVLVMIGSALRDEQQFPDADRFELDRQTQGQLAFGHGIHFCLGAQLARLEVRVALEALLPRLDRVTLRTEEVSWNYSLNVRGPVALPVELHPA